MDKIYVDKKIYLDISGTIVVTYWSTLSKAKYFNDPIVNYGLANSNKKNPYFIDRSPRLFDHVLNYLRDSNYNYPKKYVSELDFFGVIMVATTNHENNNTDNATKSDLNHPKITSSIIDNRLNTTSITSIDTIIQSIVSIETDFDKKVIIEEVKNSNNEYINTFCINTRICTVLNYIFDQEIKNYIFYEGHKRDLRSLFINKQDKNKSKIVSNHILGGERAFELFSDFFENFYDNFEMTILFESGESGVFRTGFTGTKCKIIRDNDVNNLNIIDNIARITDNSIKKIDIDSSKKIMSFDKEVSGLEQMFEVIKLILINDIPKMIVYYGESYIFAVRENISKSLIIFSNVINEDFIKRFSYLVNRALLFIQNHESNDGPLFNKVFLMGKNTSLVVFN